MALTPVGKIISDLIESYQCLDLYVKHKNEVETERQVLESHINRLQNMLSTIQKGELTDMSGQTVRVSPEQLNTVIQAIQSVLAIHMPIKQEQEKVGAIVAALRAIESFKDELLNLDSKAGINKHLRRGERVDKIDASDAQGGI